VVIVKVKRGDGEGSETIEDIQVPEGRAIEMSSSDQSILVWDGEGDDSEIVAVFPAFQVIGVLLRPR
jgi:hypothetical protein